MSDDDFMQESDEDEYEFEYEEDDDTDDVDIENKYYNAKQLKQSDPQDAIVEFLGIPLLEDKKGEWGFKGLKQTIKLELKLGLFNEAAEHYRELLTYVKSAVTRNYSEKSISNMLKYIEQISESGSGIQHIEKFYALTLQSLENTNNERLWLRTHIKLGSLLLRRKDYASLTRTLETIYSVCQTEDGSDDPNKGTYLLEAYALDIQMSAALKNGENLKQLYQRALNIRSAVPHPHTLGIIKENAGKMHMAEENWDTAQSTFYEAFRSYDEAGAEERYQVFQYLLLTAMLTKSDINPFDSQETKSYQNDPRIVPMKNLVEAYQRDDVTGYHRVLEHNPGILQDPFIAENIDEVTRNMRAKGIEKLIAPYTRMRLDWIANTLRISEQDVCDIVGLLIVDGKIAGKINQPTRVLEIEVDPDAQRLLAVTQLAKSIQHLTSKILGIGDGLKLVDLQPDEGITGVEFGVSGGGGVASWGEETSGLRPFSSRLSHNRRLRGDGRKRVG